MHKLMTSSHNTWPSSILLPCHGGAYPIHIEISDINPLTDKDQITETQGLYHSLRSNVCQNRRKFAMSVHTNTIARMDCSVLPPQQVPQEVQDYILQFAAKGLEYGQIAYGPAAISGRVINRANGVVYANFWTWAKPVPSPPSPGWGPGEIDWKTDLSEAGRPDLQVQIYSHGADFDKWSTYWMTSVIRYYTKTIQEPRKQGIDNKNRWMRPYFDIGLVPTANNINFPLADQVALLNALADFQQQHQARIVDFQMQSNGITVAIGSLDPTHVSTSYG